MRSVGFMAQSLRLIAPAVRNTCTAVEETVAIACNELKRKGKREEGAFFLVYLFIHATSTSQNCRYSTGTHSSGDRRKKNKRCL